MKKAGIALGIWVLIWQAGAVALCATLEQRIVTRVDTATVSLRHRTMVIRATGMGKTPTAMGRGGRIVRRGAGGLNKEGLLEYDLVFNGVPNYSGFKLKPIKASVTERSVPAGVKGARVFGEFNQVDALVPAPKTRKLVLPFGKKRREDATGETAGSITGSSPHP
jgi:hypothetical protein